MRTRAIIGAAAGAAALMRYPGLIWPLKPDEAGFILVARAWDPQPDSLYGPYFVDRPPPIIALVKLADAIGGAYFLRLIAAVGVALLVLALAAIAGRIGGGDRARVWTAVATAALVSSIQLDPISAKGEVLGIPLVAGSIWLALVAVQRERSPGAWAAYGAGVFAALAVGLKQNLVAGLVFGLVLLLGSALAKTLTWRRFGVLTAAAVAGMVTVVAAVVGWSLIAGVRLSTLWYAVVGFRSDATEVLTSQSGAAPRSRSIDLLIAFGTGGMALALLIFVISLPVAWRQQRVLTLAITAAYLVDVFGVVGGGSFWRAYLLNLVPTTALMIALVLALDTAPRRVLAAKVVAGFCVVSTLVTSIAWTIGVIDGGGSGAPTEVIAGETIRAAAEPGDTLVVYGGRADVQLASGLPSPYEHLWSLPMRTMDTDLLQLRELVAGPDAPTWIVGAVHFDSWDLPGHEELSRDILDRYDDLGWHCGKHIFVRKDMPRGLPDADCGAPWWDNNGPLHPSTPSP